MAEDDAPSDQPPPDPPPTTTGQPSLPDPPPTTTGQPPLSGPPPTTTGQPPLPGPTTTTTKLTDLDLRPKETLAKPLDLRTKENPAGDSSLQLVQQYSTAWAELVKPISWAVIVLLFLLMVIPFSMIWLFSSQVQINIDADTKPENVAPMIKAAITANAAQGVKDMLDWAKTFLPSLVGFATAMIGYYFGLRSGTSGQGTGQSPSGQSPSGPASGA